MGGVMTDSPLSHSLSAGCCFCIQLTSPQCCRPAQAAVKLLWSRPVCVDAGNNSRFALRSQSVTAGFKQYLCVLLLQWSSSSVVLSFTLLLHSLVLFDQVWNNTRHWQQSEDVLFCVTGNKQQDGRVSWCVRRNLTLLCSNKSLQPHCAALSQIHYMHEWKFTLNLHCCHFSWCTVASSLKAY